jgi:hypothetical protein
MTSNYPRTSPALALVVSCSLLLQAGPARAGGLEGWIHSFAQSDFQFSRTASNAPFPPMAWADVASYGETKFTSLDEALPSIALKQRSFSQAALVPIMAGTRNAIAIGEWVSVSQFTTDAPLVDDFNAVSVGVPIGWARQASAKWQLAAFIAPLGHKASLQDSSWYWEGMGGAFGRYAPGGRVTWVFGFYADVSPDDDFYVPYLGATWIANERWTFSAILPWPGVTYAPTKDTFMRLGVSPSGASWALSPQSGDIAMNLDSWNVGLALEHRIWRDVWLHAEGGMSGLSGMSFSGGGWNEVNTEVGSSPYARIGVSFRPQQN